MHYMYIYICVCILDQYIHTYIYIYIYIIAICKSVCITVLYHRMTPKMPTLKSQWALLDFSGKPDSGRSKTIHHGFRGGIDVYQCESLFPIWNTCVHGGFPWFFHVFSTWSWFFPWFSMFFPHDHGFFHGFSTFLLYSRRAKILQDQVIHQEIDQACWVVPWFPARRCL